MSVLVLFNPSAGNRYTIISNYAEDAETMSVVDALKELEEKVGFAARYRRVQQKLEELEQMVIDARFECTGPNGLTTTEYEHQLTGMLKLIRSIDEANES